MASQRDLELLDDYLANRMDDQSRAAFEQKINADHALKSEVDLQQQMISSIKQARVAELKGMLNNIPLPPVHTTGAVVGGKIALLVAVAGIIGTGIYLYIDEDSSRKKASPAQVQTTPAPEGDKNAKAENAQNENQPSTEAHEDSPVVSSQESASEKKPIAPPKPGKNPPSIDATKKIDVYDPSKELEETNEQVVNESLNNAHESSAPSIAVEIDSQNKKYSFHYQFKEGKLLLYGPFEQGLYEIMEFFSDDKRTLFLYYNEHYYLLKGNSTSLKPLNAIQDTELINKLREYRNK
jgi:hypothetical protein